MPKETRKKTGQDEKKPSRRAPVNVKRDEKGRLLPGSNLNPSGPPAGFRHKATIMDEALEREAKRRGIHLFDHLAEESYEDNQLALKLLQVVSRLQDQGATIKVGLSAAMVVEPPDDVDFDILEPAARKHLRALIQIQAQVGTGQQAPRAPGGATEADEDGDVGTAKPKKEKATRRQNGPRSSGNGRPGRPNGNGRRRKA